MKKISGNILCVIAILLIVSKIIPQKLETSTQNIQDWAMIAVFLTIGLALSQTKKRPEGTPKD